MDLDSFRTVAMVGGCLLTALLGAWLGKLRSDRRHRAARAEYDRELARLKSDLESARLQAHRSYEARFPLYTDVWSRLMLVKTLRDRLSDKACREDVKEFVLSLVNARFAVNRGRIMLRDQHIQTIEGFLKIFEDYKLGQTRLIDIRSDGQLNDCTNNLYLENLHAQIRAGHDITVKFDQVLNEVLTDFRTHLGFGEHFQNEYGG